jgi:hypothetical protein
MKIRKISPEHPVSPEDPNQAQLTLENPGDITGDTIFQQVIYHRLRIDKFTHKINNPEIPAIPAIFSILLLPLHMLSHSVIRQYIIISIMIRDNFNKNSLQYLVHIYQIIQLL